MEIVQSADRWFESKRVAAAILSVIVAGMPFWPPFEWKEAIMASLAAAAAVLAVVSKIQGRP
jgi:peptidoglycan/LPS O-acetylase OafA/YrhL